MAVAVAVVVGAAVAVGEGMAVGAVVGGSGLLVALFEVGVDAAAERARLRGRISSEGGGATDPSLPPSPEAYRSHHSCMPRIVCCRQGAPFRNT
jgi:hypothetical protein